MRSVEGGGGGVNWFIWFSRQAVLDDFDYSDEEDTLDRASQLGRQPERDAMSHPQPPPQPQSLISLSKYVRYTFTLHQVAYDGAI